ncbi:MAG: anhydro-N-acetylmuramic acid kinase, partial [Mariprofundaceae bacterium]|nr:anhydro-N-acetylmuramic acid kinase [Mariprofundaceae bacterium]
GIANITWLGKDDSTSGFDCGPGNMLMDGLMLALSDGRNSYDEGGELAATGQICQPLLEQLLNIPFLHKHPPKSTGREEFGSPIVDSILAWPEISDADRLATACALSVESIAASVDFLPRPPQRWLVCGGGACNTHLMRSLAARLAPAELSGTQDSGMPGQAVEAASFALLARQTLCGAANTVAEVTGAAHPVCGGSVTPGDNWPSLLQDIPTWTR